MIDDRRFVIESVGKISGDVSMRDVTFEDSVGFPINRVEKIDLCPQSACRANTGTAIT